MRLAASRLTISKACGHSTVENGFHQRTSSAPIDHIIVAIFIKSKIKAKLLVLQVLGQVNLQR